MSSGHGRDKGLILDSAYVKYIPIGPRKLYAAIFMVVFTILIPVGYLFGKEQIRSLIIEYKIVNILNVLKNSTKQLKVGVLLSYLTLGLSNLIALIYTPFMLRMMGQSEYGLYSLVASVVAYLTILDFGFGNAIVRYTAKYRAEGKVEDQYSLFGLFSYYIQL